jgi:CheY-like chemotaxis protein
MSPAAGASKTVLIADDTAFVRERFKAAVEEAGHRAITVRTAAELLARVRSDLERLDLLLLDLRLPNTSGPELVRAVRKLDEGRLPIVVFSGTIASAAEVRELSSLGIAGYVNEYSATQHVLPALAPHLFPDSFNRRGSPRVALGVPIAYRFGNTIAAAVTLTLSRGGGAGPPHTPAGRRPRESAASAARWEGRHGNRCARRLERPARGHGPAVRARHTHRSADDQRVRRLPFLQQSARLTAACPV